MSNLLMKIESRITSGLKSMRVNCMQPNKLDRTSYSMLLRRFVTNTSKRESQYQRNVYSGISKHKLNCIPPSHQLKASHVVPQSTFFSGITKRHISLCPKSVRANIGVKAWVCMPSSHQLRTSCIVKSFSSDAKTKLPGHHHVPSISKEESFILENTDVSNEHLTPEIGLRLITPACKLWNGPADECSVEDPFWAFYWPGGQALTRYLLDHPDIVHGRTVLDVGTGCGASAIAAKMNGASKVIANDICPVAIQAVKMNAALNSVVLDTSTEDLIGRADATWDVILLGDMFYDQLFTNHITRWVERLCQSRPRTILIGDPGRIYFKDHPIKNRLTLLYKTELPQQCKEENYGLTHGYVWKYENR